MPSTPPGQPDLRGVPSVGEIVAGKYRIERILGIGGMGVVAAARHTTLGQRVAIKFLLPDAARVPEAVARFLREGRAAGAIESEHVAKVLDVGEMPNGAPFMVMEHLSGTDLGEVLRAHGPRPIPEAVSYVLQACEAIAQAHAAGIIHRDLKPSNLFLVRRADGSGQVKVLDFGISKIREGEADLHLTATTASYGTPVYMSPEQVRSLKTVDERTDIWALGVILHELLSGQLPFTGASLTALSAAIASDPPTPLRAHAPHVPLELEAIVLRCLAKNAGERFANVGELATAIAPYAPDSSKWLVDRIRQITAGTLPKASNPPVVEPSSPQHWTQSAWGRTRALAGKSRALLITSVVVMVASLGVLAGMMIASRPAPAKAPATPASAIANAPAPVDSASAAPASSAPPAPSASDTTPAKPGKKPPAFGPRRPAKHDDGDALDERR